MPDNVVNQHYLDKVIELSEQLPVVATEDIYDARGNKLLSKGAKVSRHLQEKLILHKLTRPIEASLSVTGGVDANSIVRAGERLIRDNPALAAIMAVSQDRGPTPMAMLSHVQFGNAVTMMLTIQERGGTTALDHAVTVAITAACLAKHMQLSAEQQQTCVLGGLLHDIGELYVDPAYLVPGRPLLPHEWAHLVVHPRTGQMLIAEHESGAAEVARAVAEHHERLDGSGYPRRLAGSDISPCGHVLAAAEAISGMLRGDDALDQAEVSLKLITTEYDRRIAGAISCARKHLRRETDQQFGDDVSLDVSASLYAQIIDSVHAVRALASTAGLSPSTRELLDRAENRLLLLQRAALSSGLNLALIPDGNAGLDGLQVFEHTVATRELGWRMRELSREIGLATCTVGERLILAQVIGVLERWYPGMASQAA